MNEQNTVPIYTIKSQIKSKQSEIDSIRNQIKSLEEREVVIIIETNALQGLLKESSGEEFKIVSSEKSLRLDLDGDIIAIFKKYAEQDDLYNKEEGLAVSDIFRVMQKEGKKGASNTIRGRIEKLCEEGKLTHVNTERKRNKKYILSSSN